MPLPADVPLLPLPHSPLPLTNTSEKVQENSKVVQQYKDDEQNP